MEQFDLNKEIAGAAEKIESLAPEGKKVKIIQWSGDTTPYEKALEVAADYGLQNINGGDSRFDQEYLSYAWVSPIGFKAGRQYQIYASNSNENTYTDQWQGRYHGFKHLVRTFRNTETPIRIKPMNIYYHMYSGEKAASLNALMNNFIYLRSQKFNAITTSHYSSIARSFYNVSFDEVGKRIWKVKNRGRLNTIRFDKATFKKIDFANSTGVIGGRHFQGSLYIYLDPNVKNPLVSINDNNEYYTEPKASRPYVTQSNWQISDLNFISNKVVFNVEGFTKGKMIWKMRRAGRYKVILGDWSENFKTDGELFLHINLPRIDNEKKGVIIEYIQ